MQAGVYGNETQASPAIGIRYSVEAIEDGSGTGGEEASGDSSIAHVEEEQVNQRLRRAHHVLLRRNKLDNGIVELVASPTVSASLRSSIPIESLGDIVRQVAHVATPTVSMVQEGNKRVDVCSAASATRDDLVLYHGNRVLTIVEGSIGLDDEGKR